MRSPWPKDQLAWFRECALTSGMVGEDKIARYIRGILQKDKTARDLAVRDTDIKRIALRAAKGD